MRKACMAISRPSRWKLAALVPKGGKRNSSTRRGRKARWTVMRDLATPLPVWLIAEKMGESRTKDRPYISSWRKAL